jgi:hypothetical protein
MLIVESFQKNILGELGGLAVWGKIENISKIRMNHKQTGRKGDDGVRMLK